MPETRGGSLPSELEAISALGHEMRRPLTVIRGAATLLLESHGELQARIRRQMLTLIDGSVEELSDLIEDVLLMVHLEAGDLGLYLEPVDASAITSAAVDQERRHTAQHPVTVLGAGPGLTVEADRERAVRALRALIHNAARYSDPAAPIEVSVDSSDPATVRFEVLDRGPGIAREDRDRAFERYAQLGSGGGLGLGLYLVRGLARAMGGAAGIGDRADGGLVVWFTLNRRG